MLNRDRLDDILEGILYIVVFERFINRWWLLVRGEMVEGGGWGDFGGGGIVLEWSVGEVLFYCFFFIIFILEWRYLGGGFTKWNENMYIIKCYRNKIEMLGYYMYWLKIKNNKVRKKGCYML